MKSKKLVSFLLVLVIITLMASSGFAYDLEFILKRKALGYLIEYIKVHNIIVEAIDSGKFENSNNHVQ